MGRIKDEREERLYEQQFGNKNMNPISQCGVPCPNAEAQMRIPVPRSLVYVVFGDLGEIVGIYHNVYEALGVPAELIGTGTVEVHEVI